MPYLMLNFASTREMISVPDKNGNLRDVPSGREDISFIMIDSDKGNVVELQVESAMVTQTEREPKFSEMHTASQVLRKGVGEQISKAEYDEIVAERDSYRQKTLSADHKMKIANARINELKHEEHELRRKAVTDIEQAIIGAALDDFIAVLALDEDFEKYEIAKKLFKRMTGMGWTTEDDEAEDDPEEDRAVEQSLRWFAMGGEVRLGDYEFEFLTEQNKYSYIAYEMPYEVKYDEVKSLEDKQYKGILSVGQSFGKTKSAIDLLTQQFEDLKKISGHEIKEHDCPLCGSKTDIHIPDERVNRQMRRAKQRQLNRRRIPGR